MCLLPLSHQLFNPPDTALEFACGLRRALTELQRLAALLELAQPPAVLLGLEDLVGVVVEGRRVIGDRPRQPEHGFQASFLDRVANSIGTAVDRVVVHPDHPALDPLARWAAAVLAGELDSPRLNEHLAFLKPGVTHREP